MPATKFTKANPHLLTVFDGLSDEDLAKLDQLCSTMTVEAGSYLFYQHSEAKSAYILKEGEMMIERSSATGRRQIMAFISAGNFIGFTHSDYFEFSVQALSKATLIEVPRQGFVKLADNIPQLKDNIRRIGSNVLAHTLDQVFALGQKKAHERVCFFLKQLLERESNTLSQIKLAMTRQDIADYLGLTIETVSRAFAKLKKDGVINIHSAHTIEILDEDTLDEYALSD